MKKRTIILYFIILTGLNCFSSGAFCFSFNSHKTNLSGNEFKNDENYVYFIDALDTVVFDFSQAICTSGMVQVPVFIISDEPVYALDFEMKFNPSEFNYNSYISHQPYLNNAANFQTADSTLRFSAFSMIPMDVNIPLITIQFNVPSGMLSLSSFSFVMSWLNGDLCSYKSINIPPAPPITPGGITNIQAGDSLLLSITLPAGYTNLWSNGSAATFIYVSNTGTYSIAVTNNLGCTATSFITVTVINPLPVELLAFDGAVLFGGINISWSTASEINNDYFDVQRSFNGVGWTNISKVDGNGSTNNISNYQFVDSDPLEGDNYYKLKQVDYNGAIHYSNVIGLHFSKIENKISSLKIYPNPSKQGVQDVTISISDIKDEGAIVIYDTNDRVVGSYLVSNKVSAINLTAILNPGLYIIKYIADDQIAMCKWIIY